MTNKKIRIVGSDYSPIDNAEVFISDGGSYRKVEPDDGLPEDFAQSFVTGFRTEKDKRITGSYGNNVYFKGFVGVVRDKNFREQYDVTLQLNSRFDTDNKAYFLAAMLLSDENLNSRFLKEKVEINYNDIFDILLLYLFETQLAEASAKGIYRRYRRFENNDSRPHGVIDISRHIRLNGNMDNGKIAYNYRELTANNSLNHLILAAYYTLKSKFPSLAERRIDSRLISAIRTLEAEIGFTDFNRRKIVSQNLNPITHPYYHEYENLRKTCLKILRDESLSIFDAECSDDVESLLMYIPDYWESFLKGRLEPLAKERGMDKVKFQEEKPYCPDILGKKSKPDFVIYRENKPFAILDAKFKVFWNEAFENRSKYGDDSDTRESISSGNENIRARLDNDANKCIRDMAVFETGSTGVIFPCRAREKKRNELVLKGNINPKQFFYMTRVVVPVIEENMSFPDWHRSLNDSADETLKQYLDTFDEETPP